MIQVDAEFFHPQWPDVTVRFFYSFCSGLGGGPFKPLKLHMFVNGHDWAQYLHAIWWGGVHAQARITKMQNLKSITFVFLCALTALGLETTSVRASVGYFYTGNTFDTFSNDTRPFGSYTGSMSVSGFFIVEAPLVLPEYMDISALVINFSFNDGRVGLVPKIINLSWTISIKTDTNGIPIAWLIDINDPYHLYLPNTVGQQRYYINSTLSVDGNIASDSAVLGECTLGPVPGVCEGERYDSARILDAPGVWTMKVVPEPSTLLLFGVGLAGLAGVGWRRP